MAINWQIYYSRCLQIAWSGSYVGWVGSQCFFTFLTLWINEFLVPTYNWDIVLWKIFMLSIFLCMAPLLRKHMKLIVGRCLTNFLFIQATWCLQWESISTDDTSFRANIISDKWWQLCAIWPWFGKVVTDSTIVSYNAFELLMLKARV